jgi:M6 family metalloprotease-like protein
MIKKLALSIISFLSVALSINPPNEGKIPEQVIQNFRNQNIGENYGNPGWIKKISNNRDLQNRDIQMTFNMPVLLGKYSDASDTYFNASDFQDLLFDNNETGTMSEYYSEISYGAFEVDGDAKGWYQSSLSMTEAVANSKAFVADIAALADDDFNYALYDNDGPDNIPNSGDDDGYVDGIIIVYSGCGAEWGPGNSNIWPHQSSLNEEYVTNDIGANGEYVIVSTYAVNPELAGGGDCLTDVIRPMGVYAHEFGHILGLPDLYDRNPRNGNSEGVGEWCLMAAGSWLGFAGTRPAHMSSWCKLQLGWIDPVVVEQNISNVSLSDFSSTGSVIKVWEDDYYWSRYFLIENRQKTGFDANLNGEGLLIYHIDENQSYGLNAMSGGTVNNDDNHKLVDIEEADGLDDLDLEHNRGDEGDTFPGTTNNRNFNNASYPSSNTYDSKETNIAFENISNSDSIMYLDIQYRPRNGYAISYDKRGMSYYGFGNSTASDKWAAVEFTAEYDGYITEVDFGVRSAISWELDIYDSFNGTTPGTSLMPSKVGSSEDSGWISTSIDSIPISSGQKFFVAVKFADDTYSIPFDNISQNTGTSYYSTDGVTFSDVLSSYGNANIRAKISSDRFLAVDNKPIMPRTISLFNNFPNPFNPTTNISYNLISNDKVTVTIHDMLGKLVKVLIDKNQNAGFNSINWNGTNVKNELVAGGVYIYTIESGNSVFSKKMVLLK